MPAVEQGFLVGANQFSSFLAMAGSFEHLRHCLCSIGAGHLRTITSLSRMSLLESRFRGLAIHGMVRELQSIRSQSRERQQEMSQGLIASSILMAWYSPNPTEYSSYLKGTLAFLQPYTADNQASLAAVQGLHSAVNKLRGEGSLDSPPQPMRQGQRLLESAAASIRSLCKCKLDSELESAARELLIFLQNVRHRTWQHLSLEDQLSTMFPIRNWLRFVPRSPDRFLSNDFLLYLYMGNYETAMLAMGTVLPAVHLPLAMTQRSSGVARLRIFIQDAVNARLSGAESIANSLPVYTACMEWLALADECVESYQTRGAPVKAISR